MRVTINASDFDSDGVCGKLDEVIQSALEDLREDPGGDSANIELEIINDLEPEEDEDEESEESTTDETESKEA